METLAKTIKRLQPFLLWGAIAGLYFYTPAQLVTVDLTGLLQGTITTLAKSHLSEKDSQAQLKAFSHNLQTSLLELSKEKHWVIVPKEAVIAGVPDETPRLVKTMQAKENK